MSQLGRAVFGEGPLYVTLQFATAFILTLAANTAYADFPRLSSIIARDGYLPRQFSNQGDRLVFSNGILFLALAAAALVVAFGGLTNALIPLYAIGVFTSFTLSQAGMVRHHRRLREPGWRRNVVINGVGAVATFAVLLIVATTKFSSGAWVPLVVVPLIIALFVAIRRHYRAMGSALRLGPRDLAPEPFDHTVVVLVGGVHKGVVRALRYATTLRPSRLLALYVAFDADAQDGVERQCQAFAIDVPLEIVSAPYRDLVAPVMSFLDDLQGPSEGTTITVLIPEFVVGKWYHQALHNQTALALKMALLFRPGTVVTSVPYHVDTRRPPGMAGARLALRATSTAARESRPARSSARSEG